MKGVSPAHPLSNDLTWGTAALTHATSWTHIDDEGFATAVTTRTGSKFWAIARQRQEAELPSLPDNIQSIRGFGEGYIPHEGLTGIWDYEGLLLTPGTV